MKTKNKTTAKLSPEHAAAIVKAHLDAELVRISEDGPACYARAAALFKINQSRARLQIVQEAAERPCGLVVRKYIMDSLEFKLRSFHSLSSEAPEEVKKIASKYRELWFPNAHELTSATVKKHKLKPCHIGEAHDGSRFPAVPPVALCLGPGKNSRRIFVVRGSEVKEITLAESVDIEEEIFWREGADWDDDNYPRFLALLKRALKGGKAR